MKITEISTEETYPIRQEALYPNDNRDKIILTDDPLGKHYGLFIHDMCISVLSLFQTDKGIQLRKFGTLLSIKEKATVLHC